MVTSTPSLAPDTPPAPPAAVHGDAWAGGPVVPIRSIGPAHLGRVRQHLLALDKNDRYLRFGYSANDEQIGRYVSDGQKAVPVRTEDSIHAATVAALLRNLSKKVAFRAWFERCAAAAVKASISSEPRPWMISSSK